MDRIYEVKRDALFHELVPMSGKADTAAGELVRAVTRIEYRLWNDGDRVGIGYGNETCNSPARFIIQQYPELADRVFDLWDDRSDEDYSKVVDLLVQDMVNYIERHPELKNQHNELDMNDYQRPEDFEYEEEEDYEEDDDECLTWLELRDRELAEYPPLYAGK